MDKTINRLFRIERDSEDVAVRLSEEKKELKAQYDKKKDDYLSSTREELNTQLDQMRQDFESKRQEKESDINQKHEATVQTIKHIVEEDEYRFVDQFLEGLTKLGVATNE